MMTSRFSQNLVMLDTLVFDAPKRISELKYYGYEIILLTSRPDHLRDVTTLWLQQHNVKYSHLVMQPRTARYIQTALWKATMIDGLALLLKAEKVLLVEEDPAYAQEIIDYLFSEDESRRYAIRRCKDLEDTINVF